MARIMIVLCHILATLMQWLAFGYMVLRAFAPLWLVVLAVTALTLIDGDNQILSKRFLFFVTVSGSLLAFLWCLCSVSLPAWRYDKERQFALLEKWGALPHAPLRSLRDSPVSHGGRRHTHAWHKHQHRARLAITALSFSKWRAIIARMTRTIMPAVFFSTAAIAMLVLMLPHLHAHITPEPLPYNGAWRVVPPSYTRQLPFDIDLNHRQVVMFPEQSLLQIETEPSWHKPSLRLNQHAVPVGGSRQDGYRIAFPLPVDARQIHFFHEGRAWTVPLAPIRDKNPIAHIATGEKQGYIQSLPYAMVDDYGITQAAMRLTHLSGLSDDISLNATLQQDATVIESVFTRDLTPHPFAGETVMIHLAAQDGYGHQTHSEPITLILPERVFYNDHARALIAWRKKFLLEHNPPTKRLVTIMESLADDAARVHVAIALADPSQTSAALWYAALILDGQNMTALLQQLETQLEQPPSLHDDTLAEIRETLEQIQRALPDDQQQAKNDIERSQQWLSQGAHEQAKELLSQWLEKMKKQQAQQDFAEAQQRHHDQLQELIQRQKKLLNDTNKNIMPSEQLAQLQQQLRTQLEQLPPLTAEPQQRAQESMSAAEQSLRRQQRQEATSHQELALLALLRSLRQHNQQQSQPQQTQSGKKLKGLGWNEKHQNNDDVSLLQDKEHSEQSRITSYLHSQLEDVDEETHNYFKRLLSLF